MTQTPGLYALTCKATRRMLVSATPDIEHIQSIWKSCLMPRQLAVDIEIHGIDAVQYRELRRTETVQEAQRLCDELVATIDRRKLYWPILEAPKAAQTRPTVYLLVAGDVECPAKVGITGDPKARLRTYQTSAANRDFRFYRTWDVETLELARRIETDVLDTASAAGWGVRNEWIAQPASLLASLVEDCVG
jgi:hypothetical protein